MFKGIIALFSSGLIANPMVLLGILSGVLFSSALPTEQIVGIYKNYDYYLVTLSLSFLYVFFFQKVFIGYGEDIDWPATLKKWPGAFAKLVLSNVMTVIFFVTLFF